MSTIFKSLFSSPASFDQRATQIAYAFFRFYCGFSIAIGAGLSKVFHKIDENGGKQWDNLAFGIPDWFVQQVGDIGFTFISPSFWAHLAVYGEFIGGLMIAVGLWTRFSALQLAFQFFIVSFIWYDAPQLFSMYYQQLIFWGFVFISVAGGGHYSLDHWLQKRRSAIRAPRAAIAGLCFLLTAFSGNAQAPEQVCFSIVNPGLKSRSIDIRYFDAARQVPRGYGYTLGALDAHAVNMPVGTRVYRKEGGRSTLAFVVAQADNGKTFNLDRSYTISREQLLQSADAEQQEATARLEKLNSAAAERTSDGVPFRVGGKYPWGRMVHVRVQLPGDSGKTNLGFSRRLSRLESFQVRYPAGSKLYLCDGPYWKQPVHETLILEVDAEKTNYLVRL